MKKLLLPILLMVAVSAGAAENPVLTIEGGQVQGVLADDHPTCMYIVEFHTQLLLSGRIVGRLHSLLCPGKV